MEKNCLVWQLSGKGESHLITPAPVSTVCATEMVTTADPLKYTYALQWEDGYATYVVGKIAGQLSETDHRKAAYKLIRRKRK